VGFQEIDFSPSESSRWDFARLIFSLSESFFEVFTFGIISVGFLDMSSSPFRAIWAVSNHPSELIYGWIFTLGNDMGLRLIG
jgi:hypothetical protein